MGTKREFDMEATDFKAIVKGERTFDIRIDVEGGYQDGDVQVFYETEGIPAKRTGRYVVMSTANVCSLEKIAPGFVALSLSLIETLES